MLNLLHSLWTIGQSWGKALVDSSNMAMNGLYHFEGHYFQERRVQVVNKASSLTTKSEIILYMSLGHISFLYLQKLFPLFLIIKAVNGGFCQQ